MENGINNETVFVRLNEYKDALVLFKNLKTKIIVARDTLKKIETLRYEEKTEMDLWSKNISEIESKISSIDQLILAGNKR